MSREISQERKAAFYFGTVIMVAGGLTFGFFILTFASSTGDGFGRTEFGNVRVANGPPSFVVPAIGMGLLMLGSFIRGIGARGLAGSGVVLDTKRARRELEPYSRMAGGMVKDAIDEADIDFGVSSDDPVVMIRCLSCRKLNEEDSKFCQECGKPI